MTKKAEGPGVLSADAACEPLDDAPAATGEFGQSSEAAAAEIRRCRICGCTDDAPCIFDNGDPCGWAEPDLCDNLACLETALKAEEGARDGPEDRGAAYFEPGERFLDEFGETVKSYFNMAVREAQESGDAVTFTVTAEIDHGGVMVDAVCALQRKPAKMKSAEKSINLQAVRQEGLFAGDDDGVVKRYPCPTCGADGVVPNPEEDGALMTCPTCEGRMTVGTPPCVPCPACQGDGESRQTEGAPCPICDGATTVPAPAETNDESETAPEGA